MPLVSANPGAQKREIGKGMMVAGTLLLIFDLAPLAWVGWDVRAGNQFMQLAFLGVIVVGLALIGWGWLRRRLPE